MSSSVSEELCALEADEDFVGRLNWTVLMVLAGGCTARDFTVSMTFRHLATVVEIADGFSLVGLKVPSVDDNGVSVTVAVFKGCKGLLELEGGSA